MRRLMILSLLVLPGCGWISSWWYGDAAPPTRAQLADHTEDAVRQIEALEKRLAALEDGGCVTYDELETVLTSFVKPQELLKYTEDFVTQEELDEILEDLLPAQEDLDEVLETYVTQEELAEDLEGYTTNQELIDATSPLLTDSELRIMMRTYATRHDLSKSLEAYATRQWIERNFQDRFDRIVSTNGDPIPQR